jgi:hypothetical protein
MFTIEDTHAPAASTFVDAPIILNGFLLLMPTVFQRLSRGTKIEYQFSSVLIIKVELIGIFTLKNRTDHSNYRLMRPALIASDETMNV